jgi:hypothetical protein
MTFFHTFPAMTSGLQLYGGMNHDTRQERTVEDCGIKDVFSNVLIW